MSNVQLQDIDVYLDFYTKDLVTIHGVEEDLNSRTFIIHLLDKGRPYLLNKNSETLFFLMDTPNVHIYHTIDIQDNGTAKLIVTKEMCLDSGVHDIQFLLMTDTVLAHTMPARISISQSVMAHNGVEPYVDVDVVQTLIESYQTLSQEVNNLVAPIDATTIASILNK